MAKNGKKDGKQAEKTAVTAAKKNAVEARNMNPR